MQNMIKKCIIVNVIFPSRIQGAYVIEVLERSEGDPLRFWREINALVNTVTKYLIIQLVNELNGEIIPIEKTTFLK